MRLVLPIEKRKVGRDDYLPAYIGYIAYDISMQCDDHHHSRITNQFDGFTGVTVGNLYWTWNLCRHTQSPSDDESDTVSYRSSMDIIGPCLITR
ncbi:hypothetical protein EYC80_004840 [Monilinia laxa]|uniref:Uncharacterized protein n=1 Tax=Monilinia laxa TaxID=61186 RepID=A0A5N6KI07_MONLA|nr:hypothetical protein EYC80_004840 [Monilinia laxa]